jgi:hypothetical protein
MGRGGSVTEPTGRPLPLREQRDHPAAIFDRVSAGHGFEVLAACLPRPRTRGARIFSAATPLPV